MLSLPQKTLELLLVRTGQVGLCVEPPLLPPAFLLQHVVVPGAAALEPALLAHFEAPSSALVGLHLRHVSSAFRFFLPAKRLAAREKGRFASVLRQASVSNCCLSASGPLPAPIRLGGLCLGRLLFGGHDHDHVASVDLGPELYLPHVDVDLLFAGRLAGLLFLVFELAVVHHPDHRGVGVGGNFDEVEVGSLPIIHGLANVLDPQLLAVGRDQTHLARPDLTVYSGFFFSRYCAPLLSKTSSRGRSSTTDGKSARAPDGRGPQLQR